MSGEGGYEYRGLKARSWDLLRGDYSTWPDRPFYLDAIRHSGEPALDVGCGTGRLLLDYMAQGVDCDGVDNSPEMLAICREKAQAAGLAPTLYEQPMEALAIDRRYRTIFVPSSSIQLVLAPDAVRQAMRRFLEHLVPGGTLVMPFMILWGNRTPKDNVWSDWYPAAEAHRREDGATVRRTQRTRFDMGAQLLHEEDRYEAILDGTVIEEEMHLTSPATRWYTQEQSRSLFDDAGFRIDAVVREFTHEPASQGDRVWTVFGVRPS